MDKESYIISLLKNKYIGDDGCIIGKYVFSKDLFIENTHFKKNWFSLKDIVKKAFLVNISDAIAMNAKPKYALVGLAIPKIYSHEEIKELIDSFLKISKKYGVKIIGGDTTSAKSINISITIISKKRKHTLFRKGLKKGDLLAFTGILGNSKKDLDRLLCGKKIDKNSVFIKPILREKFIKKASKYLRCGMDISDGLSKDLSRLCKISNLGVNFIKKIDKDILCSGEEYEMLVAFSPKYRKKILNISAQTKTPITIFAKAKNGSYESVCSEHHF